MKPIPPEKKKELNVCGWQAVSTLFARHPEEILRLFFDPATGKLEADPLLYDARNLTTHAVCVGMTGSGKTGLGIGLLEEAALDGVPCIAVSANAMPEDIRRALDAGFADYWTKPLDFRVFMNALDSLFGKAV